MVGTIGTSNRKWESNLPFLLERFRRNTSKKGVDIWVTMWYNMYVIKRGTRQTNIKQENVCLV